MADSSKPGSITRQVVILVASGLILSASSCAGFLGTSGGDYGPLPFLLAMGFAGGLVMILGAFIWAIVRASSGD